VITGGTSGIGKETVRALAQHQATIHVLARDTNKAERVIGQIIESTGNNDIHIHRVDLSDFSTVRAFAKKFLETDSPIHILINNAGLWNEVKKYTVDGNENTAQANHLSHFLLTNLLLDRIIESAPDARIVNVSSEGHTYASTFDPRDINSEKLVDWKSSVSGMRVYCHTKLMNVLFTRELARRLYGKGVTVNSLHPGTVRTEFGRDISLTNPINLVLQLIRPFFFKNEVEGAQTTLYAATADKLEHVSGHYFSDCKPASMSLLGMDDKLAEDLWAESERVTGIRKA